MFDYDWFHGPAFYQQQESAVRQCTIAHFPDLTHETLDDNEEAVNFMNELECRRLIYLRDGFSYELKNIIEVDSKSHFTFECEPVDEQYKVGAFVVAVPYEDISRVEVFAVHPNEKPDDMPAITGFRSKPDAVSPRDPFTERAGIRGED